MLSLSEALHYGNYVEIAEITTYLLAIIYCYGNFIIMIKIVN